MLPNSRADVLIVGGGLSGCLLALRLASLRPELDVRVVEGAPNLCGNHTWSFFETDLTPEQLAWVAPLTAYAWSGYDVRFPNRTRTLTTGYRSIPSERLAAAVHAALGTRVITNAPVNDVEATRVTLANGSELVAHAVLDARGARQSPNLLIAFQKFLGLEVETRAPHGLVRPIIMDATVSQTDGYRFVYTLPFSPTRLLIEDTYFSDDLDMSHATLRSQIHAYAAGQGWQIQSVLREEHGVLPMVLAGDLDGLNAELDQGAPSIGLRAALFNPATGYSLPDAVRLIDRLVHLAPLTSETARRAVKECLSESWSSLRFQRLLNRMLFKAGRKDQRHRVLERFYGLPQPTIERLYRGALSLGDRARILSGKPPVPVWEAARSLSERQMLARHRRAQADSQGRPHPAPTH